MEEGRRVILDAQHGRFRLFGPRPQPALWATPKERFDRAIVVGRTPGGSSSGARFSVKPTGWRPAQSVQRQDPADRSHSGRANGLVGFKPPRRVPLDDDALSFQRSIRRFRVSNVSRLRAARIISALK